MRCLGLRIDKGQCKVALLSYKRGGYTIHELASYPNVQEFLKKKRKAREVYGIEEKDVLIKRVNTPNNSYRLLKKTLPFQIDAYFEIKPEHFLFHPFSCYTETTFVAAVSKKQVDDIIGLYDPAVITTEQSALLHFAKVYAEEYHSLCIVFAKRDEILCVTLDKGNFGRSVTLSTAEDMPEGILSLMPQKRKLPLLFLGSARYRKLLKEEFDKKEANFQVVSPSLTDAQLEYALEIGLALEGLKAESMSVQYRKGVRIPKEEKKLFKRGLLYASLSLLFLGVATHLSLQFYYEKEAGRLNAHIDELVVQYPDLFGKTSYAKGVIQRVAKLEELQKNVPTAKRFIEDNIGFTGIYAVISRIAMKNHLTVHKVVYHLISYPTVKKPKEKYSGEVVLEVETDDPVLVKEFCEALSQEIPFKDGKGISIKRDTNGFSISCSFIE